MLPPLARVTIIVTNDKDPLVGTHNFLVKTVKNLTSPEQQLSSIQGTLTEGEGSVEITSLLS